MYAGPSITAVLKFISVQFMVTHRSASKFHKIYIGEIRLQHIAKHVRSGHI
jgi:hypothetical protein